MSEPSRDVLLTGFPSFVARRTLDTILARTPDARVRLLVRPDYVDAAERHLGEMEDLDRERIHLLSGDVVAMDLGLSGREYLEVVSNVTEVFHIASIWWLGVDKKQTWEVNVQGAQNVIDAAEEMKNLRRLNHFSTAFVAGDREGVIMESELDKGQRFRNAYERTKFEAEKLMRAAMRHLPISIYRPSVIVGNTDTGEIDKLAGPYYLMYAIMFAPQNIPILMPGKGDKPLNLVPIDFVCEAMDVINQREDTAGKTFHLCDPNPLSARQVFELVAERAGKRAPIGGGLPARLGQMLMRLPGVERATRSPRHFFEDFNQLTLYNTINTLDALHGELACPPFPTYVSSLVRYIKQHEGVDVEMPSAGEILG
ncbi:MAG: SDR family oxidoreductase [Myxococcota bacterium]|jgi:thioester reductase-like protein|nr:SDR family oxidoreductase [Myxococcota bacterium]MEC9442823.1 SDR family oxidoreductase [Myxococcota bacterium]